MESMCSVRWTLAFGLCRKTGLHRFEPSNCIVSMWWYICIGRIRDSHASVDVGETLGRIGGVWAD